jgi:flagellar basal body rod protein FlgB
MKQEIQQLIEQGYSIPFIYEIFGQSVPISDIRRFSESVYKNISFRKNESKNAHRQILLKRNKISTEEEIFAMTEIKMNGKKSVRELIELFNTPEYTDGKLSFQEQLKEIRGER